MCPFQNTNRSKTTLPISPCISIPLQQGDQNSHSLGDIIDLHHMLFYFTFSACRLHLVRWIVVQNINMYTNCEMSRSSHFNTLRRRDTKQYDPPQHNHLLLAANICTLSSHNSNTPYLHHVLLFTSSPLITWRERLSVRI